MHYNVVCRAMIALVCSAGLTGHLLATPTLSQIFSKNIEMGSDHRITLRPTVKVDGRWLDADRCQTFLPNFWLCHIPDAGVITIGSLSSGRLQPLFQPTRALTLEAIGLRGIVAWRGGDHLALLSNGYQSWSNSGWLKLPAWPGQARIEQEATNIMEEGRDGTLVAREFAMVKDETSHLFIGATSAAHFKPWVQFGHNSRDNTLQFMAITGAGGEHKALAAGELFYADGWFIDQGSDATSALQNYAALLHSRGATRIHAPHAGWNSWYNRWSNVSEQDVRDHIPLIRQHFEQQFGDQGLAVPEPTLMIDDGWEVMWGEWRVNAKFPSGLAALAQEMKAGGVEPGIWIAPFLVSVKSSIISAHRDWFVKDVLYKHPSGDYRVIDVTYPPAAQYIHDTIRQLVDAGFTKLKIDFLFTGSMEGGRYRPVTGMEAYHIGLALIRQAAGVHTYLLACGAPALASLPYVDAWRLGADIAMGTPADYIGPSWIDVANQARNFAARWFYCNITHCDADPILWRAPHFYQSAMTASWLAALAGGGLYVSDDLRTMSASRRAWRLPVPLLEGALSGEAAIPEPLVPQILPDRMPNATPWKRILFQNDIFPNSSYRLPTGRQLLMNFSSQPAQIEGLSVGPYSTIFVP